MNWIDIGLVSIILAIAYMGMKTGLIGALFITSSGFIGWMIAGQTSDNLGGIFDHSLSNDTLITVISYTLIVILCLIVGGITYRIVRPFIAIATLGLSSMVDRLGGLVMGLLLGLIISGAIIIAVSRLAYNFKIPDEGITGNVAQRIPHVAETKERLEESLSNSAIVKIFIDVADAIPGNTLGFVPSDFKISLAILKESIEE